MSVPPPELHLCEAAPLAKPQHSVPPDVHPARVIKPMQETERQPSCKITPTVGTHWSQYQRPVRWPSSQHLIAQQYRPHSAPCHAMAYPEHCTNPRPPKTGPRGGDNICKKSESPFPLKTRTSHLYNVLRWWWFEKAQVGFFLPSVSPISNGVCSSHPLLRCHAAYCAFLLLFLYPVGPIIQAALTCAITLLESESLYLDAKLRFCACMRSL